MYVTTTQAIVKQEIEEALKIACESHCLSLAQVWVANRIQNSSSLGDRRTFVVKLCGYCHPNPYDDNDDDGVLDYYNACNMLP